ncbi:MAG: hypothetical protein FJ294_08720 [Planctomycetes bacterium]|nr:hypothetical protein [Planctomycetota bacterium]
MSELPTPASPTPQLRAGGGLSRARKLAALAIALASDALGVGAEIAPPVQWTLDVATALALFAVLGFRPVLLPVLVVECIPMLGAFPTWSIAVGALLATSSSQPPPNA